MCQRMVVLFRMPHLKSSGDAPSSPGPQFKLYDEGYWEKVYHFVQFSGKISQKPTGVDSASL